MFTINSSNLWIVHFVFLISSIMILIAVITYVMIVTISSVTRKLSSLSKEKKIIITIFVTIYLLLALVFFINSTDNNFRDITGNSKIYTNQFKTKNVDTYTYINGKKHVSSNKKYYQKQYSKPMKNLLFNRKQGKPKWVEISKFDYIKATEFGNK